MRDRAHLSQQLLGGLTLRARGGELRVQPRRASCILPPPSEEAALGGSRASPSCPGLGPLPGSRGSGEGAGRREGPGRPAAARPGSLCRGWPGPGSPRLCFPASLRLPGSQLGFPPPFPEPLSGLQLRAEPRRQHIRAPLTGVRVCVLNRATPFPPSGRGARPRGPHLRP